VLVALALGAPAAADAAECPNEGVRTAQDAAFLTDCRAYELVSPAAKDGAEPFGALTENVTALEAQGVKGARAAVDGERLAWVAEYALPESSLLRPYEPGVPGDQYLSKRTEDGWVTESVVPPQSLELGLLCQPYVGVDDWAPDLSRGILSDGRAQEGSVAFQGENGECGHDEPRLAADQPPGFEERPGFQNLFLRQDGGSGYRLVNPTPQAAPHPEPSGPGAGEEYFPASFLAASDDLTHVVFEEELPLTEEAERTSTAVEEACARGERGCWENHDNLYEWVEGSGAADGVRLVTILPGGRPIEGMLAGATRNGGGGSIAPDATPPELMTPNVASLRHAVSNDGSRIFFEAGGAVYVREDGAATVQVDSPAAGASGTSGGGRFMGASADGSRVYFSDDASHLLTADTLPGSGENLYECDLPEAEGAPCELTDLTPAVDAGVLGVSGIGEAGSYVYFVATGALAVGSPGSGSVPIPGQPNLYLHHGGQTTFIATLDDTESGSSGSGGACTKDSIGGCNVRFGDSCDWTARGGCKFVYSAGKVTTAFGGLTARVSENGRFLAFNSVKALTGYDNEDPASAVPGEKVDAQIFVYDADTGELACASCNPDAGVRPTGPSVIREPALMSGDAYQRANYPQRNITDDGRLFFESPDALLPEDTGGTTSVYEWEGGQLHLVSPGDSETESVFLDATPDGSDAFFLSARPLVGSDRDTSFDVYDARVDGGFPERPSRPEPCASEAACRAPAASAPAIAAPGTATFRGPGNESQEHAARPAKKKHRRHRRHRRRHHRHRHRRHRHHRRHGHRTAARVSASGGSASAESVEAASPGGAEAQSAEQPVEAGTAPRAVTEGAVAITTTEAVLQGRVYHEVVFNSPQCLVLGLICHNTAGTEITSCQFEYASAQHYEQAGGYDRSASCEPPPPYANTGNVQLVEAALAGLEPHVTYHYRLVAENEAGEAGAGEDRTFSTLGTYGPPSIERQAHSVVRTPEGGFAAELTARVNPHGYETTCTAQYVSEASYESSGFAEATAVPCSPPVVPAGFGGSPVSARADGLEAGRRYRYRFLAKNQEGEAVGEDASLLTFSIESFAADPSRIQVGSDESIEFLEPTAEDLLAGGHPYELNERLRLSTAPEGPFGSGYPSYAVVNPRDIVTTLPPGLIGNPTAVPRCPVHELTHATCSAAAQVGVLRVETDREQRSLEGKDSYYELPLYNVEPPPGLPAQLGASLPEPARANAYVDAGVGPEAGYAVRAAALDLTASDGLIAVMATIWGVPHDPSHDAERFCPKPGSEESRASLGGQCPSDGELEADMRPFLRNPTNCGTGQAASLEVDAWQGPGDFATASSEYPRMSGCEAVPFDPEIALRPTTASADSPTGLRVDLDLPQPEGAGAVGEADLRKAVVKLPQGLQVNPAGADGLAACAPEQIDLEGDAPARCPDASKIGTVEVETPLLDHPLEGAIYAATPRSNPFGSLLAIYLALDDPRTGVVVKLAGDVEADPRTGQLTTTFDESPQVPFRHFRLDFFDGPRSPLKTPATCGTFTTTADLTPWSAPEGADATPSSSFAVTSGPDGAPCAQSADQAPNAPTFSAGTVDPAAGAYSPFVLRLERADATQQPSGLSVTLPRGLTGRLAGVPYCPERDIEAAAGRDGRAELAHPDCPAASEVGRVIVAAGAGPKPHSVEGRAYLAGPHGGAPLSLAIVTPAVAGPFDLGTVVVRTLLFVNPETAQIRAVSGPIPQMLQGIPLDIRSIAIEMDRPRFTLNPTSCEPMAITGIALSTLDQAAALRSPFQVGGCAALPFAPNLALSLSGPTKRSGHPALSALLTSPPGAANIAAAQVSLPSSEILAQEHINTICTRVQFAAGAGDGAGCPPESVYGFARARTPLLGQPLEGPVYLRASSNLLPDLVAVLGGQIDVVLDGRIDTVGKQIRTTFDVLPDAPLESFTLEMPGGARGLLTNSTALCGQVLRARASFDGQNGKVLDSEPVVATECRRHRRRRHRRRHHHRRGHHHRGKHRRGGHRRGPGQTRIRNRSSRVPQP
jgi:hypothetical protein